MRQFFERDLAGFIKNHNVELVRIDLDVLAGAVRERRAAQVHRGEAPGERVHVSDGRDAGEEVPEGGGEDAPREGGALMRADDAFGSPRRHVVGPRAVVGVGSVSGEEREAAEARLFISDYFDFSLYVDAEAGLIEEWFLQRFRRLRDTAFRDPQSYFRKYAELSEEEAVAFATRVWQQINALNLRENILPTRERAHLILEKGANHRVERVRLRRL